MEQKAERSESERGQRVGSQLSHDLEEMAASEAGSRVNRWAALVLSVATAFALFALVHAVRRGGVAERFKPQGWVDLSAPTITSSQAAGKRQPQQKLLRVAVAPVISPEKAFGAYRAFVDYLGERLGREARLIQRGSYAEVNDLIRFGRCELALVCTYTFVLGEREFGLRALVVPQVDGSTSYHSLILVPRDSKAKSLLDLRGKRFASADLLSNSGWLYPVVWLLDHGEAPDEFFGDHLITGSHDRAITAVADGLADGAAVDSLVYNQVVLQNPAIAGQVRVIHVSPPFGIPPVAIPPQLNPELRDQIKMVLLHMHEDAAGREVLRRLHIDRFVPPEPGMFESVRQAAAKWEARR